MTRRKRPEIKPEISYTFLQGWHPNEKFRSWCSVRILATDEDAIERAKMYEDDYVWRRDVDGKETLIYVSPGHLIVSEKDKIANSRQAAARKRIIDFVSVDADERLSYFYDDICVLMGFECRNGLREYLDNKRDDNV